MRVFFFNRKILFILSLIILLPVLALGSLRINSSLQLPVCSCGPDLVIRLKEPPVTHHQVFELQLHLLELGFYDGPLDSLFDRDVQQCLQDYQTQNELNPDGIMHPRLWEAICADYYSSEITVTGDGEPDGEVYIVVNTYSRQLIVYVDGEKYKVFPVAIGKSESITPVGEWAIIRKSSGWGGGFGTRWLELNVPWGTYGIHGTNKPYSIGRAASAGCIRMHNQHVEQLYRWVKVGTRVKVIGEPVKVNITHTLRPGHTGKDVLTLQRELETRGFEPGYTDGRYGTDTENAVKRMERLLGLPVDGEAGKELVALLGL
ncbi:MAG: peptidoglycan-binding protein [Halanaerobium sp.]|nr:peptidoglycan-binding protein [Halanaerobium sp.]